MLNKDNIEEILKTLDPSDEAMIAAILEHLIMIGFPQDLLDKIEALLKDADHKDHNASKALTIWLFQLANRKVQEKKKKKVKKKKTTIPFFLYAAQAGYFHSQKLAICQYNIMEFNPNQILLKACIELAQNHLNGKSSDYQHTLQEFQPYTESSKLNSVLELATASNLQNDSISLASTILGTALNEVSNQITGIVINQISDAIINTLINVVSQALTQQVTKSPYQMFGM